MTDDRETIRQLIKLVTALQREKDELRAQEVTGAWQGVRPVSVEYERPRKIGYWMECRAED